MRNIKLTIEYDGKEYKGWQKQKNRLNIQGEIEQAIFSLTGEQVDLIGSGRTDSGVCAICQVANFKTNSNILTPKFAYAINSKLKKSIRIKEAQEVPLDFHARYDCKRKTYQYTINNEEQGSAIFRNLEFHIPEKLDVEKMQEAVKYFIGEHDFSSFKSSGTGTKTTVRTIYETSVRKEKERIYLTFTGNGFLYNMVRIMVGTLVEVRIWKNEARSGKRDTGSER